MVRGKQSQRRIQRVLRVREHPVGPRQTQSQGCSQGVLRVRGHPEGPRQTQSQGLIGCTKSARAPRGSKENTVSRCYREG